MPRHNRPLDRPPDPNLQAHCSQQPLPVSLYIHSGGWYAGSMEIEDYLAHNICEHSNIILYSPFYRLAPENPFPAGHNDVFVAYEYMAQTAAEHGADPTKKFVMGGSAGGNLTASVCLKFARTEIKPQGAVILCPGTAHTRILNTLYKDRYHEELYADAPIVGNDILKQACIWLGEDPEEPLASVLLHEDIPLLPPLYVAATTKDPTFPETMFFVEKCREGGVDVDVVEWKRLPHFFHTIPSPMAEEL